MSDVLVSFVVPAYNEEVLIGSCLAAITAEVSRTGCPAEVIVVNNGSSDNTSGIALATPGVKVIDEPGLHRRQVQGQWKSRRLCAAACHQAAAGGSISEGSLLLTLPTRLSTAQMAMSSAG